MARAIAVVRDLVGAVGVILLFPFVVILVALPVILLVRVAIAIAAQFQ